MLPTAAQPASRPSARVRRLLPPLNLAVPPGTTVYLVDTPWNEVFSPAEPMTQMPYGPSVRVVKIGEADVAAARADAQGRAVFLGVRDGRLSVLAEQGAAAGR